MADFCNFFFKWCKVSFSDGGIAPYFNFVRCWTLTCRLQFDSNKRKPPKSLLILIKAKFKFGFFHPSMRKSWKIPGSIGYWVIKSSRQCRRVIRGIRGIVYFPEQEKHTLFLLNFGLIMRIWRDEPSRLL